MVTTSQCRTREAQSWSNDPGTSLQVFALELPLDASIPIGGIWEGDKFKMHPSAQRIFSHFNFRK